MMKEGDMLTKLGSSVAGLMFIWAMFKQYFPFEIEESLQKYFNKLVRLVYPYIEITFHEFSGDGFERSKAYASIERYLGDNSSTRAKRLRADMVKDSQSLILSMDDYEEISDEYQGVKLWWKSNKSMPKSQTISWYPNEDERRFYKLTFHSRNRDLVTKFYLDHVMKEGKEIAVKTRRRKLFTNSGGEQGYRRSMWSHVVFEHPASFGTLAMEPKKKQDIINDLITFSKSKDYYAKIGKAWKRGYLLYGPPGTGKSTMIAAMANLLEYDIYDLELTAVKDNTELRKLLIDTTGKSVIVIEDIDCSLDLTGQRKKEKDKSKKKDEEKNDDKGDAEKMKDKMKGGGDESKSKVTLSGLLNFIDGLWSAVGGERIIVFTTNYVEKLDPALIRRGRMDKHIELSYCCFEAFKLLAKNYLDLDSHVLFERISELLGETKMTPADVAENLMPKCLDDDPETCLENLIKALKESKEQEKLKAEEEDKRKIEEKEQKEKEEKEKKEKEEKEKEDKEKEMKNDEVKEEKKSSVDLKENGVVENH